MVQLPCLGQEGSSTTQNQKEDQLAYIAIVAIGPLPQRRFSVAGENGESYEGRMLAPEWEEILPNPTWILASQPRAVDLDNPNSVSQSPFTRVKVNHILSAPSIRWTAVPADSALQCYRKAEPGSSQKIEWFSLGALRVGQRQLVFIFADEGRKGSGKNQKKAPWFEGVVVKSLDLSKYLKTQQLFIAVNHSKSHVTQTLNGQESSLAPGQHRAESLTIGEKVHEVIATHEVTATDLDRANEYSPHQERIITRSALRFREKDQIRCMIYTEDHRRSAESPPALIAVSILLY